MKLLVTCVFALYSFASFAQVTKKVIELPEFKSIYLNANYTIYLKQTNKQEVQVEVLTEIFSLTEIKVEDGILMVNLDRKPESPNKSIWAKIDDIKVNPTMKIYISMKQIQELQINGGGKIISENSIASPNLQLAVNGNGNMDLDIKGEQVKLEVTGSGNLKVKGYATAMNAFIGGTGNILAFDCPVETAKIKVSGSGNCDVNVAQLIDALVYGSGTVRHKGNTKTAQKKVFGLGTVDRAY